MAYSPPSGGEYGQPVVSYLYRKTDKLEGAVIKKGAVNDRAFFERLRRRLFYQQHLSGVDCSIIQFVLVHQVADGRTELFRNLKQCVAVLNFIF